MSDPKTAGLEALKRGDPKSALQSLGEAVQLNPNDSQAHALLGTAYGQLNMFDRAAEALGKAVQLAPDVAAIRFNHGTALEKLGRREEAVEAYRKALSLDARYERASQALSRLGAAPQPAGSTPVKPAASGSPATPAGPATGLGDFALGGGNPVPHGGPSDVTLTGSAPATPAPTSPYGATPSIYGPAPTAYGAPPPTAPPVTAGPQMAPPSPSTPGPGGPPMGLQPLGDWTPPPSAAPAGGPPQGLQPLGDWTPPPTAPGTSLPGAPASTPYGPPPGTTVHAQTYGSRGAAVVATAEGEGASMPRSTLIGHAYLIGMGLGVWWGLIGALITFLMAMATMPGSRLSQQLPVVLTLCAMWVALGTLLYGVIGLCCGGSDDPESLGHNLGIGLGFVTILFLLPMMRSFLTVGAFSCVGTIWVSRMMGKSVGGRIAEFSASTFIVAGAKGVALTRR